MENNFKVPCGIVRVTNEIIRNEPEILAKAFYLVGFVPFEIRSVSGDCREYLGYCKACDEVSPGSEAGHYSITMYTDKNGILTGAAIERQ